MLEARWMAQLKSVHDMKATKGENWQWQYTRVLLDRPVEKAIVSADLCPSERGKTLNVDLKVVQEDVHINALDVKVVVDYPPTKWAWKSRQWNFVAWDRLHGIYWGQ